MSDRARRYNARNAPFSFPVGALLVAPGLEDDRGSESFYRATLALQGVIGAVVDGYFGPGTRRAMLAHFPVGIHGEARQGAALEVGVWGGFARPSVAQLQALVDAGCSSYTVNLNDAGGGGSWKWSPSKARTMETIERCLEVGLRVVLMPWVWCSAGFMRRCGEECAAIIQHFGKDESGHWRVSGIELDAEGSWEVSAKSRVVRHDGSYKAAVSKAMAPFLEVIPDGIHLAATLLYFKRAAGDALLRLRDGVGESVISEAAIQAYSVWLPHKPGTHTAGFQPGTLQRKAFENYDDFKFEREIDVLTFGLGWWAQERMGQEIPAQYRLGRQEAIRRASDAILEINAGDGVGIDGVKAWAMHLWDGKGREEIYHDLALEEIRYLTAKSTPTLVPGPRVGSYILAAQAHKALADPFRPYLPRGYKRLSRAVPKEVSKAAVEIRAQDNPLGTYTEIHTPERRYMAVDCLHTHTWRAGKMVRIRGGIHGVTVFGAV